MEKKRLSYVSRLDLQRVSSNQNVHQEQEIAQIHALQRATRVSGVGKVHFPISRPTAELLRVAHRTLVEKTMMV